MSFVILPNQLFDIKYIPKKFKKHKFIIWEHPHYFKKYNYNQKKLILHRASMKYYFDYLKKNNFDVAYIEFNKNFKIFSATMFDPVDKLNIKNVELIETPNFLLTKLDYHKYKELKGDKFMFHWFYMWGKKINDIIPNVKSKDKDNRKKLPKNIKIPPLPTNKTDKDYIDEAVTYINKNFSKNYGNTKNFLFPVTHKTAEKWLSNFLTNKFDKFGPYQDAIDKENDFLFHSCLSTSINIGLINPLEIIKKIRPLQKKIPINSYEGYIRQLYWREYQRYCYIYFDFKGKNYFGNNKSLSKKWYNGSLGIEPVDDCIIKGFENGYLNHIQRLMVVGNFMNLSQIKPMDGFRWFMEFSCDAYEWVMTQNVLDMVFCVTGAKPNGGTMAKPYISSSNYILNMSNYKKGEWAEKWTKLYHQFVERNRKKLLPFKYYFRSL